MPRFPGYIPPFQYYKPYNYTPPTQNSKPVVNTDFSNKETFNSNTKKQSSNDTVWLDLFGIKLYFDDVLILSLLFFLYKENVKDDGLFLALVLLLIS